MCTYDRSWLVSMSAFMYVLVKEVSSEASMHRLAEYPLNRPAWTFSPDRPMGCAGYIGHFHIMSYFYIIQHLEWSASLV